MCRNKILGDLNFSYSYNLMNFLVERGLWRGGGRAPGHATRRPTYEFKHFFNNLI